MPDVIPRGMKNKIIKYKMAFYTNIMYIKYTY